MSDGRTTILFPLRKIRLLWHPDSPGVRVPVRVWRWSRRDFATLGEVLRYYRALALVQAGGPGSRSETVRIVVNDRIRDIFRYGSVHKRVFTSPDLFRETLAVVKSLYGVTATVHVPDHWAQVTNTIVAWDVEMERPDV